MEENNETVNDIIAEARNENGNIIPSFVCFTVDGGIDIGGLLDRIEAAHKREILVERKLADDHLSAKDAETERLRRRLKVADDALLNKSDDGKYVNNGGFLSEEFVDDDQWRKAI